MKPILITSTMLAGLVMGTNCLADHTLRRDYEVSRVELKNDYEARREAHKYRYHRERDVLRAERAQASRIDCHETRALRLREFNRELHALSRDFAAGNRSLASWYHRERNVLRDNYELASRRARIARPVVFAKPALNGRLHAHPADCECSVCSRPGPVNPPTSFSPPVPSVCEPREAYGFDGYNVEPTGFRNDHRRIEPVVLQQRHHGIEPVDLRRNRRNIDWASLLVSLLSN